MTDYVLFKFRKIDKYILKSLVHSELYFARPDCLNDPFDCRVDILRSLQNAIARSAAPSRQKLEQFLNMKEFFQKVQKDHENIGVCSFSLEIKSPLMWSHYADDHRGICLTYSFPESFFYENAQQILGIDEVDYGANPLSDWFLHKAPVIGSFEDFGISLVTKALTVKAHPWQYEKEVRIIRKTHGVHAIDKPYLKQVCFGMATSDSDVTLVRELIDQCGYEVVLAKMERSAESDFGLNPSEI